MQHIKRAIIIGIILVALSGALWARTSAEGGDMAYGDTVTGTLQAGASDVWHFIGGAGDLIAVTVQRKSGNLEPAVTVQDSGGQPVAGTAAAPGQGSASLVQLRLVQGGSYLIQVAGNSKTAGDYSLTLTLSKAGAPAPTAEATASADSSGALNYGQTVRGQIDSKTFRQLWHFRGAFGDVIDIRMTAISGDLHSVLALQSPLNDVIAASDAGAATDAAIQAFQLPYTGEYTIIARRAGSALGQAGTTSGAYELSIAIRGPGTAAQNTALNVGTTIRGQLKDEVPQAVYRLEVGGSLITQFDLGSLHRMARVRFLTPTGDILGSYEGLSPLTFATKLPDKGPFLVEISTTSYETVPQVDFGLTVYRLSATTTSAHPIFYGNTLRGTAATGDKTFFIGHSGDLVSLILTPDQTAINSMLRVTGPQDVLLYQGQIGPSVRQTLTLPDNGAYEIEVRPDAAETPLNYDLSLTRLGAFGIPFGRFAIAADRGTLSLTTPTSGTLQVGGADGWWLDAAAGQVITLIASTGTGNFTPGLALQRPDGSNVDVEIGERVQGAVIQNATIQQTGRYRVVVFDSKGSAGGQYTVQYEEGSGGNLQVGQVTKGAVSSANSLSSWALDVTAGALINARLTTLTPDAWTPSLSIADPDGLIVASAVTANGEADVLGVQAAVTGRYHFIVAGQVSDNVASFDLLSNVQAAFTASDTSPIQVTTTSSPLGRYVQPLPVGPIQVRPADLIDPALSLDSALANVSTLKADATARGEILNGALSQSWRIDVSQGMTAAIQATALDGATGPSLTLLDRNNKIVDEEYRSDGPTTFLTYHAVQNGPFVVVVQMGLGGGRYLLSLTTPNIVNGPLHLSSGAPMVYGSLVPGEILNQDEQDNYYFLGTANDVISAQLARASGDLAPGLQLTSPHGSVVASDGNTDNLAISSLSQVRLAETGIYNLTVKHGDGGAATTGRYFLYLGLDGGSRLRKGKGGIIAAGETRSGLLSVSDTDDIYLFAGHGGERVSFSLTGQGSQLVAPLGLRLQDTSGQTFALRDTALTQSGAQLSDVMLPADGIYRLQVSGGSQTSGAYTLTWLPEVARSAAGPLSYDQTVNGVFTTQHNADTWVFAGTAGDVVSIAMRYERGDPFQGAFQIRSQNGVPLTTVPDLGDGSGARVENLLLPFDGDYIVAAANPDTSYKGAGVYSLSVNLQDSKAHSMGGILAYGQQAQGAIYPDDAADTWIFSAQAGDLVDLSVQAQDQFLKPSIELRTLDGKSLASSVAPTAGQTAGQRATAAIDKFAVPAGDTYVISVSGGSSQTAGSYLLSLDDTPQTVGGAQPLKYGDTKEGLVADDRPLQSWLFTAAQGDTVTATMTRESGSSLSPVLELRKQSGTVLARADGNGQDKATISSFKLAQAGQYLLVATRYLGTQGKTSGRYNVTISGIPTQITTTGTLTYGTRAIGRLGDDEVQDRYTFVGKAGDVIGIVSRATSGNLDTALSLEDSSGHVLAANDDSANSLDSAIGGLALPADGTYIVKLSRVGGLTFGSSGNYELTVNLLYQVRATAAPQALISYGERAVGTVELQAPERRYTFGGNQGDVVSVQLLHQTDDAPPQLSIQDPAGTQLVAGTLGIGQTTIDRFPLPASGVYTIVIQRPINTQLSFSPYTLTLRLLSSPTTQDTGGAGGVLSLNDAVTGTFSAGAAIQYWLFQGQANQSLTINLLRLNGDVNPALMLLSPGGQSLVSAKVPARGQSVTVNRLVLPADGIYSLLVLPGGPNLSGQYRLTLQPNTEPASAPPSLTDGQTVSGTLDPTKPEDRWTYQGAAGVAVTARMIVTGGTITPQLRLVGADGNVIAEGQIVQTPQGVESALIDVPLTAGSYTFAAGMPAELGPQAGSYTLAVEAGALSTQAAAAQPLTYGQEVSQTSQQGVTDLWSFSGAEGDTVTIAVLMADNSGKAPAIILQDAAGRVLQQQEPTVASETSLQGFTLPAAGRYVIALPATATGRYNLLVQRRENLLNTGAVTRPLVINRPLDSAITDGEVVDYWTFSAKAGNVIQIAGTRLSSNLRLDLSLYGPSASYVSSVSAGPDGANVTLGPTRLPVDGQYTVVVTRWLGPSGTTAGRYSLTMTTPSNTVGSTGGFIPLYGRTVTGGIGDGDNADTWTFDGQAGDVVNVRMTRLDGNLVPLVELGPNAGTSLASADAQANQGGDTSEALISRAILPADGRYTITAGRSGATTGGYKLTVERVENATQGSIDGADGIAYGQQKDSAITAQAPRHAWVFFGKAGERVSMAATPTSGSGLAPFIVLLAPNGDALATSNTASGGQPITLNDVLLPSDGFYGVIVSGNPLLDPKDAGRVGAFSLELRLNQPGAAYQGHIDAGSADASASGTLTPEEPTQEWTFTADSPVAVTVASPSAVFNTVLTVYAPGGATVATLTIPGGGNYSVDVPVSAAGDYTILVRAGAAGGSGRYTLAIAQPVVATETAATPAATH